MSASATIWCVRPVLTTRELAGAVVDLERSRLGLQQIQAAEMWHLGPATLRRMEKGEFVSDRSYRRVEGVLQLPRFFLAHVIEGNRDRIRQASVDDDLRQYVMDELDRLTATEIPRRRASDRR